MGKKFSVGKMFALILSALILSSVFTLGAAAGTLAPGFSDGGEVAVGDNDTPLGNVSVDDNDTPLAGGVIVIDHALAGGIMAIDAILGSGALVDDDGALFADVGGEAAPDQPKTNPATGDNTMLFVILSAVSLAILGTGAYFAKKAKKVN